MGPVWQQMTDKMQDFNVLSYLSSHDTRLFREGGDKAAELLLLSPRGADLTAMNPLVPSAPPAPTRCKAPVQI